MKKKIWTNPKYKDRTYLGFYRKAGKDRVFQLECVSATNTKALDHVVSFESVQKAKEDGWEAK